MKSISNSFIYILAIICLVAVGGLLAIVFHLKSSVSELKNSVMTQEAKMVNVSYKCDGDKEISAVYVNGATNSVQLNLPNNKTYNLMQTLSADGGRYANWDNSFVFWSKGDTAFVEQDGNTTYENCVQTSSN